MRRSTRLIPTGLCCILSLALVNIAGALDDGTLRISVTNGWKAFEVITVNDNPSGNYAMPGTFDGMGAQIVGSELRVQVNHELGSGNGTISEVNLNLANFKTSVDNMVTSGNTGGGSFVNSAQQAYDRWSDDGGSSWTNTTSASNTSFDRFCSGQSYNANAYGLNRGFVDNIYITGEEFGAVNRDRLFAVDLANRDMFQLSGVTGNATGGIGGMPFDSWENAALLDTGETNHVALLLSPDGGTQTMQLYIGEKGKDENGTASASFLARNGLAYGSYYYLNDALPTIRRPSTNGSFDTTLADGLTSSKLEDVDTSLADPTQAVLGDQNSGLFTFDFDLDFSGGSFAAGTSDFSITKLQNDNASGSGSFNNPDNVDWTDATTLNGTTYADGLIFVNEDSGEGEMWMMEPDGTGLLKIGQTLGNTESTGIVDISDLVGFNAGSVLLSNNQGSNSSLSVLINPNATLSVLVVAPDSVNTTRGLYVSGGVVELAASDNADLSVQRAVADTQSRTEFEVKAISPVANPSSLEVTLEGSVFVRSQVNQTIELFDYVAGSWEQVDTRAATRFTDSTATVAATGDLSRFVEAGTMCIEARIRYQSPVARQRFSSNTDQFIWMIGQ